MVALTVKIVGARLRRASRQIQPSRTVLCKCWLRFTEGMSEQLMAVAPPTALRDCDADSLSASWDFHFYVPAFTINAYLDNEVLVDGATTLALHSSRLSTLFDASSAASTAGSLQLVVDVSAAEQPNPRRNRSAEMNRHRGPFARYRLPSERHHRDDDNSDSDSRDEASDSDGDSDDDSDSDRMSSDDDEDADNNNRHSEALTYESFPCDRHSSQSQSIDAPALVITPSRSAKKSDDRSHWVPDKSRSTCTDCQRPFSTFTRRHHCRTCGQLFCSACCQRIFHTRLCRACAPAPAVAVAVAPTSPRSTTSTTTTTTAQPASRSSATQCSSCLRHFGPFVRRHVCRECRVPFCSACCQKFFRTRLCKSCLVFSPLSTDPFLLPDASLQSPPVASLESHPSPSPSPSPSLPNRPEWSSNEATPLYDASGAETNPQLLELRLFSVRATLHSASNLPAVKFPNPYVRVYITRPVLPGSSAVPEKLLVFRSLVASNDLNPVWEQELSVPFLQRSTRVTIEVLGWHRGVNDPLMGIVHIDFRHFMPRWNRHEVPLCDQHGRPTTGILTLSLSVAQPSLFPSVLDHPNKAKYLAIPFYDVHAASYGVTLPNFRDVGGFPVFYRCPTNPDHVRSGRMKTRRLFRSSAIHRATRRDADIIINTLEVRSLLDLRTADFAGNLGPSFRGAFNIFEPRWQGFRQKSKLARSTWVPSQQTVQVSRIDEERTLFLTVLEEQGGRSGGVDEEAVERAFVDRLACVGSSGVPAQLDSAVGRLYLTGLVGVRFETDMVVKSSPKNLLDASLALKDPVSQRRIICGPVFDRADGIAVLYRMIVDHCKFEICHFFLTLLDAAASHPLAFFCNHGKDRTGLMAAFVQAVCGVDHDAIFDGYCLSDFFLYPIKQIVNREMTDGGLTPAIMSRSPREAMKATFDYLQQQYGSVSLYLAHIGFDEPKQRSLRDMLVDWDN